MPIRFFTRKNQQMDDIKEREIKIVAQNSSSSKESARKESKTDTPKKDESKASFQKIIAQVAVIP